ncbi:MAG: hypothetical protein AVDCRST_MAG08-1219, partial [uncultured Acetobacteraceae bacterium]
GAFPVSSRATASARRARTGAAVPRLGEPTCVPIRAVRRHNAQTATL